MTNTFRQKGFTLIELLVVIVILGILSTISVGTFRNYFAKARDSERVSAVQNIAMMVKVGTGGDGNCGVYNLGLVACVDSYNVDTLILENDYKMPESKSGLTYYYGFKAGTRTGDNDFFVVIGAEESKPQNGQELKDESTAVEYAFVDGTRAGIDIVLDEGVITDAGLFSLATPGDWKVGGLSIGIGDDEGEVLLEGYIEPDA